MTQAFPLLSGLLPVTRRPGNSVVRSTRKQGSPNRNDSKSTMGGVCEVVALSQVLFDEQREASQSRLLSPSFYLPPTPTLHQGRISTSCWLWGLMAKASVKVKDV